ncbi:hypothetical protein Val02_52170 [Virgisporangium aliadipatigenens]|uniref:CHAT domain-containing protein n=1 Tax=Virgisporangium aliadipatigenens TaxID=741659 RepID=A0A8J3YN77_9ACTN|nr:CHAT domain-containing protein [Virgisporangium aliadipatigenens]GIJ48331.1 hypothetical protein Val02_52170 [Virgisporangium aliadipatigenens]
MRDVFLGDNINGDKVGGHKFVLGAREPTPSPRVILVASADPLRSSHTRLDEEQRAIVRAVTMAHAHERLTVRGIGAVRFTDLRSALLASRPTVLHLSGHGTARGEIVFLDDHGLPQTAPAAVLTGLFRILRGELRCVVLSACFTDAQAVAAAAHVPCVVGMSGRVADADAIRYTAAFYDGLAHGGDVRTAHELGLLELERERLGEHCPPVLVAGRGVAESTFIIDPLPDEERR